MNNRAHKTTGEEFRASLRELREKNPLGISRVAPRSRKLADPAELFDDEIPFGNERSSNHMPGVPATEREQLDRMLDAHGLPKILRTLRELCDERKPHDGAAFESFEPIEADVAAEEHADELESLLLRLARRVQG